MPIINWSSDFKSWIFHLLVPLFWGNHWPSLGLSFSILNGEKNFYFKASCEIGNIYEEQLTQVGAQLNAWHCIIYSFIYPPPPHSTPLPMKFCCASLVQCCIPSVKNSTWHIGLAWRRNFWTCLAVLGLCCCQLSLVAELGTSHRGGFSCCGAQAPDAWASVAVACGFSSVACCF